MKSEKEGSQKKQEIRKKKKSEKVGSWKKEEIEKVGNLKKQEIGKCRKQKQKNQDLLGHGFGPLALFLSKLLFL